MGHSISCSEIALFRMTECEIAIKKLFLGYFLNFFSQDYCKLSMYSSEISTLHTQLFIILEMGNLGYLINVQIGTSVTS